MSRKEIIRGFSPFLPILIGAILKFSLIDNIDGDVSIHLIEIYLRPLWIEFIVISYITGMTIMLSKSTKKSSDIWIYFGLPAVIASLSLGVTGAKIGN